MRSEAPLQDAPAATRPYLPIPFDLLLAFKQRPAVIGIYAAVMRLNVIYKRAVDLSRADLAAWCGDADRNTRAGCITRAVADLSAAGWLIKHASTGRKWRLLAGWGRARPLAFDRKDRGRPKGMNCIKLPLDLFDLYLGRLTPDSQDAAQIDRYFNCALLDYADIGAYTLCSLAPGRSTPRLRALNLTDANDPAQILVLPFLPALLNQATAEQLHTCAANTTPIAVTLSAAGGARQRKSAAASFQQHGDSRSFFAQDGSVIDPSGGSTPAAHGSADGSRNAYADPAIQRSPTRSSFAASAAWDSDGMLKKQTHDSSSHESHHVRPTTTVAAQFVNNQNEQTPQEVLTRMPYDSSSTCEDNHINQLDPLVRQWHQALNPGRAIAPAECFALLDLQQRYGSAALRRWQAAASNAGKTLLRPRYYETCAQNDALAQLHARGRQPVALRREAALPPAEKQTAAHVPAAATDRQLDPARAAFVADIAQRVGSSIRRPGKLADVPLDLLESWCAIASHPGLLATKLKIGWLIDSIASGHAPPTPLELDSWAEQAGIGYYHPRMIAFRQALAQPPSATVPSPATPHAASAEPVTPDISGDAAGDPQAADSAPLSEAAIWQAIVPELRRQTDRRAYTSWLQSLRLMRITEDRLIIGTPSAMHKAAIEQHHLGLIRTLLHEHCGRALQICLVIAPASAPPPAWVAAADWQALPQDMQTALLGSVLADDGGLHVRADADDRVLARYATMLLALLERTAAPLAFACA